MKKVNQRCCIIVTYSGCESVNVFFCYPLTRVILDKGPPKSGGLLCPFWGRGAGSPSNIISLGPRPTSVPSGILIHPTVWPQYTVHQRYKTHRQRDNGPIAQGKPFYKRSPQNSNGIIDNGGVKHTWGTKNLRYSTNNLLYL